MKTYTATHDNITAIYTIGTCATQNTEIINNSAKTNIWFHIRDQSSCHVIMQIIDNQEKPTKKTMHKLVKQGALYCKQHTNKCKSIKNIEVIYSFLENIETTDVAGQVKTYKYKTIIV